MSKLFLGENVTQVVVHDKLHLDELLALWLLLRFGQEAFPGIETAVLEISGTGGKTIDGRQAEEWELEGALYVGTGGGRFDEHRDEGKGKCCAQLVAEALAIEDDPALGKIMDFTVRGDTKGGNHPFDIAYMVKTMHSIGEPLAKVLSWASQALQAVYADQQRFFGALAMEFKEEARISTVPNPKEDGEPRVICAIESDEPAIDRYARSKHGCDAAAVIVKNSKGQVQIYANKKKGVYLDDAAVMIRLAEQRKAGQIKTSDWKVLAAEGNKIEGAEAWYYHPEGRFLLNGSLTAPNVPPTLLSLNEIMDLVRIALTPAFEPARAEQCRQGKCASSAKNPCPWYQHGLKRCRQIRFQRHEQQAHNHPRARGNDQNQPRRPKQQPGKTCAITVVPK